MLKKAFSKTKYASLSHGKNADSGDLSQELVKCPACSAFLAEAELMNNYKVCPKCNHHLTLSAWERISLTADPDSFEEFDAGLSSYNPLDFPEYQEKLSATQEQTGLIEAVVCGYAAIQGRQVVLAAMDNRFMMASMGSVVGEKICRAAEKAMAARCPLLIFCTSGGARMQEGMFSLMQMAKTSAVMAKFHQAGLLYVSILTHPTTGGVSASFASLADIIIAEPGALVGFTGPRVIEQTLHQKLPTGFQRSEYLLEHGMVDMVVPRTQLINYLGKIIKLHQGDYYVKAEV